MNGREPYRGDALRELRESDESLPAGFDRVAASYPSRIALVSDRWQMNYSELRAIANRVAHAIAGCGGKPGDRVAILMDHDAPAVASVIAVLKAGCIVVSLNQTHPVERLRLVIEDSEPSVIVTDANNRSLAAGIAGPRCAILCFEDAAHSGSSLDVPVSIAAGETAVLAFTSGSTGRPKAVMMTHRGIRRHMTVDTEAMGYSAADRISLFGSLSGGQGTNHVWSALLNGATLCPFPVTVKGVTGLADWMGRHRLTVYASSASIFRNFVSTLDESFVFRGIRAVRLSSEPATSDDFRMFQRHFPDDSVFVHTLSSSETGTMAWSACSKQSKVPDGRLPVGVPAKGQELLLLDENGHPVGQGAAREIVVRGRHLAAGYWRDPELTAARFSGALDGQGTREFRSGDLARIDAGGVLEFCGRRDDRIKIRGNRIELGEIEAALHGLPGIKRAVVEAIARPGREPILVGFLTLQGNDVWSTAELRRALRAVLPDAMVPSEFAILETFPLTATGKIDRQKLRGEYRPQRQRQPEQQPVTATETLLAAIWAEVFELDDIGRDEDFFVLGGDSLIAAVVSAKIHDAMKADLNLAMFAEHPTLADLASVIDTSRSAASEDEPPVERVPRTGPLPLSFTQERIWKYSRTPAQSAGYTVAGTYRISGALDRNLLHECMDELARRHEILRSRFFEQDGKPVQTVDPAMPLPPLLFSDLSSADNPEAQANILFKKQSAHAFDLARGPLLRFHLVRLRADEHWLLRVAHHIVCDNMTWSLYFKELASLYDTRLEGKPSVPYDPSRLQYAVYSAWQRKVLRPDGPVYRRCVAWWKENLSGAPQGFALPFLRERPEWNVTPADGILSWGVAREVSFRLNALSSSLKATHAMVRLAAFAALLASDSGVADVVIGMYATGRTRSQFLDVLGDFSNLMLLRFRYDSSKAFSEWLAIVRDRFLQSEKNNAIPFETLCEEMNRAGLAVPAVQVIFHVPLPRQSIEFSGLSLRTMDRERHVFPWGFTANFNDQNETDGCQMLFDPRYYSPVGVRRFTERYKRLLDAVSRHPEKPLASTIGSIT